MSPYDLQHVITTANNTTGSGPGMGNEVRGAGHAENIPRLGFVTTYMYVYMYICHNVYVYGKKIKPADISFKITSPERPSWMPLN